jgi:GNAT superfamily N-acetyltransferase
MSRLKGRMMVDSDDASTTQLLSAMEANFLAYFLLGLVPLSHMQIYSDPELTWAVSSKFPGWNTVLRTQLAAETTPIRVQAMVNHFRTSNLSLGWLILPSTRPLDLPYYLLSNGMKQVENRPHMLVDLQKLPAQDNELRPIDLAPGADKSANELGRIVSAPGADKSAVGAMNRPLQVPGLTVELVHDSASFEKWYTATIAGFEMTASAAEIYHEAYTRTGFDPAGPFLHYVGLLDGEPVTSSTLLLAENIAGIYDVSTAPAFRGRRLASAITLAPLLEARARGYRYSCLQSSKKGYNVYRRLGFVTQYHEKIFAL